MSYEASHLNAMYELMLEEVIHAFIKYRKGGSGSTIGYIVCLHINIGRLDPLRAFSYIKLPNDRSEGGDQPAEPLRPKVAKLLLIKEATESVNSVNSHYTAIKNMSRLLSSQVSSKKARKFFCLRCLNSFGTQTLLQDQDENFREQDCAKTTYPAEGKRLRFKNWKEHRSLSHFYFLRLRVEPPTR